MSCKDFISSYGRVVDNSAMPIYDCPCENNKFAVPPDYLCILTFIICFFNL